MSDDEELIEDLLFFDTPNKTNFPSTTSSKEAAGLLRNGSISDRHAIPSSEFLKRVNSNEGKKKPKRELFDTEEFTGKWVVDDDKRKKKKKDFEDRLSKKELLDLYESEEEDDGFIVSDDDDDAEEGEKEILEEEAAASSGSETEKVASEDEEECSWNSEDNEDDSEELDPDSEEEHQEEENPLSPWTRIDFEDELTKTLFFQVTTKEMFSWSQEKKETVFYLMQKCLVHPPEKGFSIYSQLRRKRERVGKESLLADFEKLKLLCRDLERNLAATVTNSSRSRRAARRSNGEKQALPPKKRKMTGPKKAKDIRIGLAEVIKEIVKIQFKDFQEEKEARVPPISERPYHDGAYLSAAKKDSVFVGENEVDVSPSVVAVNVYQHHLIELTNAFFGPGLSSQFSSCESYSIEPPSDGSEFHTLTLYGSSKRLKYVKLIAKDEVAFYRTLLNYCCLFLTIKMLIVCTSTTKGQRMRRMASKTASRDLSKIKLSQVSDIVACIVKKTQLLHALAFPDDPEGHRRLKMCTVQEQ